MKNFVVVTKDWSGLGWAMRLKDEGHKVLMAYQIDPAKLNDEQTKKGYELVGNGIIDKFPLKNIMSKRDKMKDWYWVWDANHNVEENELLKKEGFKVFMGGKFADMMEHDRNACLKFAEKYGLKSPESFPFSDAKQAIKFVEQNEETAYVFKPDEGENFETWVPESEDACDANHELQRHLETLDSKGNFILQERKEGVETNIEVWFVKGEPKFAFMGIESKKKIVGDLGEFTGCAFDFVFEVPLDCEAVKQSVGKLYPAYRAMNFTGLADANFIAAKDGIWFFEKCERFGYNAHPNLLFNLNQDELGETLASLVDGTFKPNFTPGFGSSVSLYTDHPKSGKAIQFPEKYYKNIYFWDAYKEGDKFMTAGYDGSVLIALGFGYTIPTAWESCLTVADKIKFPGRAFRNDGDKACYPSSPLRRYEALVAMGLI